MIKLITPLFLLLLISISCQSIQTLPQPDKTVEQRYGNLIFTPEKITRDFENNLLVTIEPVDASDLNTITARAAMRAGNYERESLESFYDLANNEDLSSTERFRLEYLVKVSKAIQNSVNDSTISSNLGYNLTQRIWGEIGHTKDGSQVNALVNKGEPSFNPYYINSNYLSVFKLEITNKTNRAQVIKFDNFQISSGSEILYPRNMLFFEEVLQSNIKKENAFRFNLPDELTITPNQSVVKYLAVPPINSQEPNLSVQYIKDNYEVVDFAFEQQVVGLNNEITFKNYLIHKSFFDVISMHNSYDYYYSVEFENGYSIALRDNSFFIPNDNLKKPITVCGAVVPTEWSGWGSTFYNESYHCKEILPSEFESGVLRF